MNFLERYRLENTWHGKVTIMEIYHLTMSNSYNHWTISDTADDFECSIGLVSENLKLAREIDKNPKIIQCETRQDALRKLNHG